MINFLKNENNVFKKLINDFEILIDLLINEKLNNYLLNKKLKKIKKWLHYKNYKKKNNENFIKNRRKLIFKE